ncbi:MAG: hypothetical protein ACE5FD_07825 [Anaerolineae bacterium]
MKLKLITILITLFAFMFLTACGGSQAGNSESETESVNFVTHEDPDLGVTVSYPEGWITHNSIGGLTVASDQKAVDSESMADIGDAGFVLIIPGEIDVLNFQTNQEISEDAPLPALFIYQQLLEEGGQDYLGVEAPRELELDGQTVAITLAKTTIDGVDVMTLLAVIMHDGQIALISAGAQADSFVSLRPSFEQIIQSIQVTTPAELSQ